MRLADGIDLPLTEELARNVGPAGIDIAYQRLGDPAGPPVLLIMGMAAQLIHWPDSFCQELAGHGLHLIRFDNRDAGRSTHLTNAPAPNLPAVLAGDLSTVSYTLSDMAADTVGLLDVLGIDSAHVVGASMGGAIAQTVAIEHPARVRSLTAIMSTTGDASVGQAAPEVLSVLFAGPPGNTRDEVVAHALRVFRAAGSSGFDTDEAELAARAGLAFDRGHDPLGIARQAVASVASGDRTARLAAIAAPTLVIHGLADRLCDASGGRAIAAAIPGAELWLVEGQGHDLPPALRPELARRIAAHVRRAEAGRIRSFRASAPGVQ
ncbi:Pimeloyl-ACP methyl ester carboxylesterase [Nannocystis exedens]|uniref:Pimeloyl-ACP methyl ester carboxylesterase n=1 Tax=Nannocystis exedens TaxID=54 RepID=A0A1I2E0Q1_9BACT|nr:alpha/beta fold hydrolase [Nannocystis exedens]PCC69192.1 alpha/beta hydrolase [Nannocystis exedens]SFE86163.1 Pimeloyl-ACP methyl ester carboxylesterase [Nannocystis exedens]